MSRYDTPGGETWDVDTARNKGFPYTFPFIFDRIGDRNTIEHDETWGASVSEEKRYGETSSETFTTPVSKTGRYGANP